MTIELEDSMRELVERRVREENFEDASALVKHLLVIGSGPEHLRVKSHEDLEAKLMEGLASGPGYVYDEEYRANFQTRWEEWRRTRKPE
jgi:Arc/MetJ-type ribon-helix-helix transcriptional regulator